jgi:polyisoprenoid-binding protein YceI
MKSKGAFVFSGILIILLVLSSFTTTTIFITTNGKVNFKSEAPLEIIRASSSKLTGLLNTENKEFVFSVPMNSFEGFNSPLQRVHFNENYIESDKFPDAKFKGKIIEDIDFNSPGAYKIRAKGKFFVHGKENPMTIKCDLTVMKSEIQVNADFDVRLKDHDIQIPAIVNQKLSETINVSVKFVLKPKK